MPILKNTQLSYSDRGGHCTDYDPLGPVLLCFDSNLTAAEVDSPISCSRGIRGFASESSVKYIYLGVQFCYMIFVNILNEYWGRSWLRYCRNYLQFQAKYRILDPPCWHRCAVCAPHINCSSGIDPIEHFTTLHLNTPEILSTFWDE